MLRADAISVVTVVTLASGGLALWIRRHTWRMPWETAATANVALQTLNVVLLWPLVSHWISPKLHAVTGLWNVEELVGHIAYTLGLAAVLYMAAARLDMTGRQFSRFVNLRIGLPLALFIPVVIAIFMHAGLGLHDVSDLVFVDVSPWLLCYWCLYIAAIAYLLGQAALALLALRRDPRQTRAADFYLAAIGVSLLCCFAFLVDANSMVKWTLIRAEVVAYALAAGYSWHMKVRYLRGGPRLPDSAGV
ncbi:MAG TPA: hypothetical protein VFQ37_03965 [Mycobacterium sp.]|nr:hypothetical protein [Mycobacterium sp.]